MSCCSHCRDANAFFGQRDAMHRLARYQRHGPEGTTRLLIEALGATRLTDATLLDIGGGIGVVHHELLRAGAAHAVAIDAATAALSVAETESQRLGHAERVTYLHGDFVTLAPTVAPATLVILDRVVCCYPAMPALIGAAAARAERFLGLVYPHDAWWVHLGMQVLNTGLALQRTTFRVFCHPTAAVDAQIRQAGLTQRFRRIRGPWQVVVYERLVAQADARPVG